MKVITGHCTKCGAPYYQEEIWFGTEPPPLMPTCVCWNIPKTETVITINTQKGTNDPKT